MAPACGNVAKAHSRSYLCAVHKLALRCAAEMLLHYFTNPIQGVTHEWVVDRRKGFESKWAHDADMQFRIMARRDKLLGLWVAAELGLAGEKADAYAKSVVVADLSEPGDEDVFRKVRGDLDKAKFSDHSIRQKMADLLDVATEQVQQEVNK
jgi:hypothetical protein